jgi:hypothetical protein
MSTISIRRGDLVFVAGSDGIVRAFAARTGQPAWTAYTGGAVLE